MNLMLIYTALKSAWKVAKKGVIKSIPFLWKYKSVVIISLLLLWVVVLKQDVKKEQHRVLEGVQSFEEYKKEQREIYLDAVNKAKETEKELINKQLEVERKYVKEIEKLNLDISRANNSINGLHKELSRAKTSISTAPEQQVRDYSKTATELLDYCSGRIIYYATKADKHAIAEKRAVETHNTLIDTYNTNIMDNKSIIDNKKSLP